MWMYQFSLDRCEQSGLVYLGNVILIGGDIHSQFKNQYRYLESEVRHVHSAVVCGLGASMSIICCMSLKDFQLLNAMKRMARVCLVDDTIIL